MTRRLCILLLAALAVLAGAPGGAADVTKDELMARCEVVVGQIGVQEAKAWYDLGSCVFLDVRTQREFRMGHIPGAVHVPRGLLEFDISRVVPDKKTWIVVYCRSGQRACLAASTLLNMGYPNVVSMERGWLGWDRAWYPVQ